MNETKTTWSETSCSCPCMLRTPIKGLNCGPFGYESSTNTHSSNGRTTSTTETYKRTGKGTVERTQVSVNGVVTVDDTYTTSDAVAYPPAAHMSTSKPHAGTGSIDGDDGDGNDASADEGGGPACVLDLCLFGFKIGNPTSFHVLGWGISVGQPCGVTCCYLPYMCG